MPTQRKFICIDYSKLGRTLCLLVVSISVIRCAVDYPATTITPTKPTGSTKPDTSICSCTSTSPASGTSGPGSTTNTSGEKPVITVDTLNVSPPLFLPNGGKFHGKVGVRLEADSMPPQAVYEYSIDNGLSWQQGQQFTLTIGGTVLTRFRVGNKVSRSRTATFNLYFERVLIIGNSIMSHAPDPSIGWFNFNGMAASAPEKDFVHILTRRLETLHTPVEVKLQSGGNFERQFGTTDYSLDEFNQPLAEFKPDLVIVRIGENVDERQVVARNFEKQFNQLLERLASYNQPIKIICTTSVWDRPQTDAIVRKVANERSHVLVDLKCMVGQGQYFAGQYQNPGVAAHPNDVGMQRIADLLWTKINNAP